MCSLESVASLRNLFAAARLARKGKSRRAEVEAWRLRRESEIARLRAQLNDGTYRPAGFRRFTIFEPKRREIAAAPFSDRVVHHAICLVLQPLLQRRFIARSFSCQIGKGTTAARECCRELANRHRFALKCDVSKFFASIDHEILLAKLAREIRCRKLHTLCQRIVDAYRTRPEELAAQYWLFTEDDLLDAAARPRGLPLGALTSQLWANFYLDDLDHWVTETQQHGAYLRYTDDFVLFGDDKARLWKLRAGIIEQLARVRLRLSEPKSRMLATKEGVPFCGWRFLPGLRPRVLGEAKRRFERRRGQCAKAGDFARLSEMVYSWYQYSREGNTEGLRRAYLNWPLDPAERRAESRKHPDPR